MSAAATTKKRKGEKQNSAHRKKQRKSTSAAEETVVGHDDQQHAELLESVTGQMNKMSPAMEAAAQEPAVAASTPEGGVDKEAAAEYLLLWDSHREKWSFKKKTQYWLLQNMYDKQKVKVSKSNFKIMLRYLDGLHGNQRGLARDRACGIVKQLDPSKDESMDVRRKHKRAKKVLEVLKITT